jgi:hypothetical protein
LALFKMAWSLLLTFGSRPPAVKTRFSESNRRFFYGYYLPLAADTISRDIFEYMTLFLASLAPLVCLTLLHLL